MTRGRYLCGGGRGSRPARIVSVVVQPVYRDTTTNAARGAPLRFHSAHCALSDWRSTGWGPISSITFDSPTDALGWIHRLGISHRKCYLFAPQGADALTLLRFWEWLDGERAEWAWGDRPPANADAEPLTAPRVIVRQLVLRGTPDIVEYRYRGHSYQWTSTSNYYRQPEEDVAAAVGHRWLTEGTSPSSSAPPWRPPGERAVLWVRAMQQLADWWAPLRAGRWPVSIPSAAYAYMKSRLTKRAICTHTDERMMPLERAACHGGRMSCWYYGDVRPDVGTSWPHPELPGRSPYGELPGPAHHWDVSSMYPALMRDGTFPVKRSHYTDRISVQELGELLHVYDAVARVDLLTAVPEYPHRYQGRIVYPVGRYVTVLAGDELRQAVAEGSVHGVIEAGFYWRGRPFERAAAELLEMRAAAKRDGRPAWEMLIKLLSNSLTGKLAQRRGSWTAAPGEVPLTNWGEWSVRTHGQTTGERYRARAGLVERWAHDDRCTGTVTAAYACLTASGRLQMRRIRESLPPRTVLTQTTDGLRVLPAGHSVLLRTYSDTSPVPGRLRSVGSAATARYLDATHHVEDGVWTLAGFSAAPPSGGSLAVTDSQTTNPVRHSCDSPPNVIWERYRQSTLTEHIREGGIGPDGWLVPFRLPGRGPRQPAAEE